MSWFEIARDIAGYVPPLLLVVAALLLVVAAWTMQHLDPSARWVTAIAALAVGAISLATVFVDHLYKWGIVLALVPNILILQHGTLQTTARRPLRQMDRGDSDPPPELASVRSDARDRLKSIGSRARSRVNDVFGPATIGFLYGVPALLTTVLIALAFVVLHVQPAFEDPILTGARYASVGAYVYVVLFLGQRAIRRDLTGGAAAWGVITLAIGPILGAIVALVWLPPPLPTPVPAEPSDESVRLAEGAVYFIAGFSPRWLLQTLEEAVHRLFLRGSTTQVPNRLSPLTLVRGISQDIADRLSEETVSDVTSLAYADPIRLFRNTAFPNRVILTWIDEAMLMTVLPEAWPALERQGITGAIDLAWLHYNDDGSIATLATECRIDPKILTAVVARLAQDVQVTLVWFLYQYEEGVPVGVLNGAPQNSE